MYRRSVFSILFIAALAQAVPDASFAQNQKLTCTVQSYAHSGFSSRAVMESWFPRTTTHFLSNGQARSPEQGLVGEYKERDGRIKIVYAADNVEGDTLDLVYTFIKKTSVFTVRLVVGGEFMDNAGTQGFCRLS